MPSRRRGYAGVRPSRTGCWGKTRRRTYSARVSGVSPTALAVSSNAGHSFEGSKAPLSLWT